MAVHGRADLLDQLTGIFQMSGQHKRENIGASRALQRLNLDHAVLSTPPTTGLTGALAGEVA